jgi:hypothetical protein
MLAYSTYLRVSAFVVCSAVAFQPGAGPPAKQSEARAGAVPDVRSVRARIRTDRQSYSLGDTVRVDFLLENGGPERVYVDRRMFWGGLAGGLQLVISDESGKPVSSPDFLNDALMPPPKEGDAFILIPLDRGFTYGTFVTLSVGKDFPQVGRYYIRVIYQSRLPKEFVLPQLRGLPALWADTPQISSEPISISVTK